MILMRFGQFADLAMGGAMRQPAKDDVDLAPVHLVRADQGRQIEARQMREDLREALTGMTLGDQRGELEVAGWRAASLIRSAPV